MDEATKARAVEMLRAGASNKRVALVLGLTVNQVGGVRYRTIGRTMSQRDALKLPKERLGTNQTIGPILGVLVVATRPLSSAEIGDLLGFKRHRVYMSLRPLVRGGVVIREGRSPQLTRYRLAVAEAAE